MADKKISFEDSLKQLEEIAARLESDETSLEEAISLFEKGTKLSKECSQTLDKARQKITMLADAESEEMLDD